MADPQFDTWKKLLAIWQRDPTKKAMRAAMAAEGLSFNDEEPLPGYYRLKRSDGRIDAIGIWREGDEVVLYWGVDETGQWIQARPRHVWPHCVWHPVPWEWFEKKMSGGEWPDIHVAIKQFEEAEEPLAEQDEDEAEAVKLEIERAKQGIAQYAKIEDDLTRDKAQSLRSELLALRAKADKRREELKRPHFEAAKAVDKKWMPLVDAAKGGADQIKTAQDAWENAKFRRQREEQQKREQEERERAAENQKRTEAGQPPLEHNQPPAEPWVPPIAPTTTFRGGTGRAAHVNTEEVVSEITDIAALALYYRDDADVKRLLITKATRTIKATGEIPPGIRTETKRKVA